jgi:hypothetical protein
MEGNLLKLEISDMCTKFIITQLTFILSLNLMPPMGPTKYVPPDDGDRIQSPKRLK